MTCTSVSTTNGATPPTTPSSRYFVDVGRYRFSWPALNNPAFYPIPQEPVTRDSYLKAIEETNPAELVKNPKHGMNGPRAFMPILVKYVETGDSKWSDGIREMFHSFHQEMQNIVAEKQWFWQFEDPAVLIPIYRKHLVEGGAISEDTEWFRDMWLYYCRNLHVWDSKPTEWRGGCRSEWRGGRFWSS